MALSTLEFAKRIAKEAGRIQVRHFRKKLTVNLKGKRNPVTNVDRQCERTIITAIKRTFPSHGYYAEEGSKSMAEYVWVVDPLDGTTNYARGFPCFCVSIALTRGTDVLLGVIYDPLLKQLFWAEKGRGAYLNGKRLRVSSVARMEDSLVTTGFAYKLEGREKRIMRIFHRVLRSAFAVRRPGSAALDLAFLAAGFTDGHYEHGLHPWDVAAGVLLVQEAGGKVILPYNDFCRVEEGLMAADNGRIHTEFMRLLEK